MNLTTTNQGQLAVIESAGDLADNPVAFYLAGMATSSRRPMGRALDTIAKLLLPRLDDDDDPAAPGALAAGFPWQSLKPAHMRAVRAALAEMYSPSTANRHLSALRGVVSALASMGAITYERKSQLLDPVKGAIKGERTPPGRDIPPGDKIALLATCDDSPAGIRDAAIIGLLSCGLRRAELVGLDLADWDVDGNKIRVMGKGNKQRQVPLINGATELLADWLLVRGRQDGPLFTSVRYSDTGRLGAQTVYDMLKKRAVAAGIKSISPHDFRRTAVGDMLATGTDIVTTQKYFGHADPATTAGYDRRGEQARIEAANKLSIPYRKRVAAASHT